MPVCMSLYYLGCILSYVLFAIYNGSNTLDADFQSQICSESFYTHDLTNAWCDLRKLEDY